MDNNVSISSTTKELVLDCIRCTNKNLYKWVHENGYPVGKISDIEVKALLFGYLKKFLIKTKPDFKRLIGNIKVTIKDGMISKIWAMDYDEKYYNDKSLIIQICSILNNISEFEYKECVKYASLYFQEPISSTISKNPVINNEFNINFESIKTIKF